MKRSRGFACLYIAIVVPSALLSLAAAVKPIDPRSVLVGLVVDTRNENMTSDALLTLRSLRMFGGSAANVDVVATLVHHNFSELQNYTQLLRQLANLRVEVELHAPSPSPMQQTCNKLFAFEAFQAYAKRRHQWFLYLDSDMLIMDDFLGGLETVFNDSVAPAPELLCFPSWDYYMVWPASQLFNTLLSEPFKPPGNWSREHPVAHCNTGVMFMTPRAMRDLWKESHRILHKELAPWMTHPPFLEVMNDFSHVDSWTLAVAAARLDLEVAALPVEWNYLVAADVFIANTVGVPSEERKVKIFHFLAETRLAFSMADCGSKCDALLVLRNTTDASPTLQAVRPLVDDRSTCAKLAGCEHIELMAQTD